MKPLARTGAIKGTVKRNPNAGRKMSTSVALQRMRQVNTQVASRPDIAQQHIPGRFSGQAGKRLDASITRAVKEAKAAERARTMKPKEQVRAESATRAAEKKAAAAAKPKRTRSPQSLRVSRAKKIVREREMKTKGTLRQWENSVRIQKKALDFYTAAPKPRKPRKPKAT
jgi:hypothetical protein